MVTPAQLQALNWREKSLQGFIHQSGPLWTRREDGHWAYGLLVDGKHLNPAGMAHGGALVTLVDHAISTVAWEASARTPCVTLQLDTHFVGAVKAGQFVEARAAVVRQAKGLVFMAGNLTVDGTVILTAQALMKVLDTAPGGTGTQRAGART